MNVAIEILVPFILVFFLIFLFFKVYKTDSDIESVFFTVDTSRTMKFMLSYLIAQNVAYWGVYLILPFLLFGLLVAIGLILFLLINFVFLIINLILLIFGVSIGFIGTSGAENINLAETASLLDQYYFYGLYFLFILVFTIAPILSGIKIGNYSEDTRAITIVGFTWFSFFTIFLLTLLPEVIDDEGFNLNLDGISLVVSTVVLIGLNFLIYYFFAMRSYVEKIKLENYELPEIKGYSSKAYLVFGILPLILSSSLLVSFPFYSSRFTFNQIDINLIFVIFTASTHILFSFLVILFFIRGDHPLDQKVAEIEIREDLLEMAKEFKDLDISNIDNFVKKTSSKLI